MAISVLSQYISFSDMIVMYLRRENKYFSPSKLINKSYSPRTALDIITLNASNKNFSNKNTNALKTLRPEACKTLERGILSSYKRFFVSWLYSSLFIPIKNKEERRKCLYNHISPRRVSRLHKYCSCCPPIRTPFYHDPSTLNALEPSRNGLIGDKTLKETHYQVWSF